MVNVLGFKVCGAVTTSVGSMESDGCQGRLKAGATRKWLECNLMDGVDENAQETS